ncbi:ead/Ea22-like family protein [Lysinibacillus sphaericus]|uniref:ead/Ea22-like family protein n=1 Tax=Lysinibacillus sphaericus TaxID=1421 RepID=UPI0019102DDF|nr:ead/Ea22-like family protein [Lysinibacillus sphaericus]QPA56281.1 ead/Ea22-like family protein [Lysinibacillus sphaericus]
MKQEQLNAIKERVAKATPGEWRSMDTGHVRKHYSVGNEEEFVAHTYDVNDAEFIAHARKDVPALVAEVERLRELIKELACDTAENTAIFLRKVRVDE